MPKAKSVKNLDLFGRRFTLELMGSEKTGTFIGLAASILVVLFMLWLTVPELQKVLSHEVAQTSYSKTFYQESVLPDLAATDVREYFAFEVVDNKGLSIANWTDKFVFSVWTWIDDKGKYITTEAKPCSEYGGSTPFFVDMKELSGFELRHKNTLCLETPHSFEAQFEIWVRAFNQADVDEHKPRVKIHFPKNYVDYADYKSPVKTLRLNEVW